MNRRQFLRQTALASGGWCLAGCQTARTSVSANDKLNVGVIGVANRAGADLHEVAKLDGVNVGALCDVDDRYLARAKQDFPRARTYNDYRRLLDQPGIDAVVVGTPDHTHAVATVAALESGRHVYCEKPLTHTVAEARLVAQTARRRRRVTQMGTQIHAGRNYRRVVELMQAGVIGAVREVHVWVDVVDTASGRPQETLPVPAYLHYDLWLGPVPHRPYSPEYVPKNWRRWWAFGGGALEDFGCHHIDLAHWALGLRYPSTIEAEGPPLDPEGTSAWLIVRYSYPARGAEPAVRVTWYHGGKRPHYFAEKNLPNWGAGSLFVGDNGMLLADYSRHVLLPEDRFSGFVPPAPFIPNSIGHHKEWVDACKTGGPTTCNFDYSGALTEAVLLGNVAYRVGRKLDWDAESLRATNCPEADTYIQYHYRKGWKL